MVLNKSQIYEGYWKGDKPDGRGRIIFQNGEYYDGIWVNGKYDG